MSIVARVSKPIYMCYIFNYDCAARSKDIILHDIEWDKNAKIVRATSKLKSSTYVYYEISNMFDIFFFL